MKFSSSMTGDDALLQAFDRLPKTLQKSVMVDILKESGEPIRATAAILAPRSKTGKDHLADNIVIAETRFGGGLLDGEDVASVAIGPSHRPHDKWYGTFVEEGTAHHPAQPFLRPAFDTEKRAVMRNVKRLAWAVMRRAIGGA